MPRVVPQGSPLSTGYWASLPCQTMDKKELKEGRDYFGSWFEGRGSIMVQEQVDGAVAAAG